MKLGRKGLANDRAFRVRVQVWAAHVGVVPKRVRLQEMRRKWASCSSRGIVSFNRELLQKSSTFQDRVIVHELVHLRVPNHGRLFRRLVAAYLAGITEQKLLSRNLKRAARCYKAHSGKFPAEGVEMRIWESAPLVDCIEA